MDNSTWKYLDQLTLAIGVVILIFLPAAAWFPQPCPLIRQAFSACPVVHLAQPLTSADKELSRIPHQTVTGQFLQFSIPSQDNKGQGKVDFYFQPVASNEVAYLQEKETGGFVSVALVTAPVLNLLDTSWLSISTPDVILYHQDDTVGSLDDFTHNLPPAKQIAADSVAAKNLHLTTDQYTLLDSLNSLDGIHYILSSAGTQDHDGAWHIFDKVLPTDQLVIAADKQSEWGIQRLNGANNSSFILGTVHVDFLNTTL